MFSRAIFGFSRCTWPKIALPPPPPPDGSEKSLNPNRLPPTEAAATKHIHRAYLHDHNWVMLNAESLNPLDYGWKLAPSGTYEPVATKAMIAPESILDLICCKCSVDMEQLCLTLRCSCRNYGFNCLPACGRCHGVN